MAYDFPNSPALNQVYQGYTWDGEKWGVTFNAPNQGGVIAIKVFTASGTYTPSPNMTTCVIEAVGGGGCGGNTSTTNSAQVSVSSGGGGGGYAKKFATATDIGASQTITVGAGGVASGTGGAAGPAGGNTSIGTLCAASGGNGGIGGLAAGTAGSGGVIGGVGTVGDVLLAGDPSGYLMATTTPTPNGVGSNGGGAGGGFGAGGAAPANITGFAGRNYGGGGSGVLNGPSIAQQAGGNGANGVVIITEYGLTSLGSSTAASGAVRYDLPQGLTANQQVQARQNVYAAPFDAMAYSGMQINGAMEVSQERGFYNPVLLLGTPVCDGWVINGGGVVVSTQVSNTNNLSGLKNWLNVGVSTPKVTLTTTDYVCVTQKIEGYRIARLGWGAAGAQPITIAFWTCHNRPGTYTGTIRNPAAYTRVIAFSYTQNVSDTWEYKTVTLPGCIDGVWEATNNSGLDINLSMGCGPTYTAPSLNAWTTGIFLAGPGQVNALAATTDVFRITGLVVLPGIEAPSAARSPLIMRPYDQELLTCQRYYAKINAASGAYTSFATGFATTTIASGYIKYPVRMRAAPAISYGGALAAWNGGTFYPITSMASVYAGLDCATVQFNGAFTVSAVNILANNDTTAFMWLDARI